MLVDFDKLMLLISEHKQIDNAYVLKNIFSIFQASDLDGSQNIDFFEFKSFLRPINYDLHTDDYLKRVFLSEISSYQKKNKNL